jgi:hypothetical protein
MLVSPNCYNSYRDKRPKPRLNLGLPALACNPFISKILTLKSPVSKILAFGNQLNDWKHVGSSKEKGEGEGVLYRRPWDAVVIVRSRRLRIDDSFAAVCVDR